MWLVEGNHLRHIRICWYGPLCLDIQRQAREANAPPERPQTECREYKRGRVTRLTLDPAEESPSGGAKSAPWHRLDIAHRSSGLNPVYPAKPVCAAVNHHSMAAIGDLQRGVHTVQPTFDVDFAARSQELQFHS